MLGLLPRMLLMQRASQSVVAPTTPGAYTPTALPDADNSLAARLKQREKARKRKGRASTLISGQMTDDPLVSSAVVTGR